MESQTIANLLGSVAALRAAVVTILKNTPTTRQRVILSRLERATVIPKAYDNTELSIATTREIITGFRSTIEEIIKDCRDDEPE